MQMEHEKCLEIMIYLNAQIKPTLMGRGSVWVGVTDLTTGLPTFGSTDTPTYRIDFF